jgi:hypothetical protein
MPEGWGLGGRIGRGRALGGWERQEGSTEHSHRHAAHERLWTRRLECTALTHSHPHLEPGDVQIGVEHLQEGAAQDGRGRREV